MLDSFLTVADIAKWCLVIYSWVHIAAFLLSWVHADPSNKLVYYVNRVTIPLWDWVRARVPRGVSPLAPYLALMLVLFLEIFVPGAIRSLGALVTGDLSSGAGVINIVFYFLIGSLSIVNNIVWFVFFLSVIWFVFTLVNPSINNPIVQTVMLVVDPFISPLQKFLPRARVDLSPLVLALLSFIVTRLIGMAILPIQMRLLI